MMLSVSSPAQYNAPRGADQDHDVKPHRPVIHIVGIKPYALGVVRIASSADLPETGDPWPYTPVHLVNRPIFRYLCVHYWAGSNQAHLSPQDVRSEERRVGKECRSRW